MLPDEPAARTRWSSVAQRANGAREPRARASGKPARSAAVDSRTTHASFSVCGPVESRKILRSNRRWSETIASPGMERTNCSATRSGTSSSENRSRSSESSSVETVRRDACSIATVRFTLAELAALYFSRNMLVFLEQAPFGQDLESAFAKIREALPQKSLPFLSRIQDLFSARPDPWKDYSKKQDVIAALIDAILHQRQARIAYYSFNSRRTKSYLIDPYRLVYYRGGLYLYARAHEYDEVRTFAVERMQQVEVREGAFEIPKDVKTRVEAKLYYVHSPASDSDLSRRLKFIELAQMAP